MSEELEPTSDPKARLKESDWIVIVALWERGEVTLSELSTRFGVSKAALSQGLKRRKAVRGSKAHVATKKIQEKIESEKEKLIEDIYNFKKRHIEYGNYLSELAVKTVRDADAPGGKGVANVRGELLSIAEAVKIASKVRDDHYYLYDLYDKHTDNSQDFSFNVGVYSEKDIDDLRKAQKVLDTLDVEAAQDDEHEDEDEVARLMAEPDEDPEDYEGYP